MADILAMAITAAVIVVLWKGLGKAETHITTNIEIEAALKPSKPGVIITFDREHGSNGKQIGRLVADRLGVPFYYKEMIALAAKESGLATEFIDRINVDEPCAMHSLYLSTEPVQQAIIAQEQIIRKIADNGSCVIVGRAAGYVLREHKNTVSIFIHAPEDYRVAQVMKNYGDTREQADKSIARSDTARSSYFAKISGLKWGDTKQYDLCLDSSIGMEQTANVILTYVASVIA